MRLIDGDSLKEEISNLTITITGIRAGKGVLAEFMKEYRKTILRTIAEQPTIEYGTWIPCSERLPEEPELCLITQKIGTQKVRKTALRSSGEWRFNGRKIKDEAVIAWMPLPEPYREVKKDE